MMPQVPRDLEPRACDPRLRIVLTGLLAAALLVAPGLLVGPAAAQSVDQGVDFLVASQRADGGWSSPEVRSLHATTEALRALQAVGRAPASRSAAADLLEVEPVRDTDDRARRLGVLAAEGRDATADLIAGALFAAARPEGGWGLLPGFRADPLDTALSLTALADREEGGEGLVFAALGRLATSQRDDGGWPCVDQGDSEVFCTAQALLALTAWRDRFFLRPQIDRAVEFLRARFEADGGFGPAGPERVIGTALASLALGAVPAFEEDAEIAAVVTFLEGSQQNDGSWRGDPYTTALAIRALQGLFSVPFCGDDRINQPGEVCDGSELSTTACSDIGQGTGTLGCTSRCTFDTSACSVAATCGDDLRNQIFEVCDGTDLGSQSCQSLGFATGTLACTVDCTAFDETDCQELAVCGDGVVNQPGELCDFADLDGTTCEALGLGAGTLHCGSDCTFVTSDCNEATSVVDNQGREFVVGFLRGFDSLPFASVHLTSRVPSTVTVEYPVNDPFLTETVSTVPGEVTVVPLPRSVHSNWPAGSVVNNAVRVSSSEEVVVYLASIINRTSDAAMALPLDALGTEYIVTTARGSRIVSRDRSEFLVLATADDTTVTITPTTRLRRPGPDALPGVPFEIRLDRGEGFRGEATFARRDLTGTVIQADRRIAVLNGNVCANIPGRTAFCDHIFEVAHPVASWGTRALVANLPNRPNGSVYRVTASEDGTRVFLDGVLQTTLNRGQFIQRGPVSGSHLFEADRPVFVTQFMTGDRSPGAVLGDPAMANMIPPEQYLESYTFSTVGGTQFPVDFLTVIAPNATLGDLRLDGAPVETGAFTPIGGTDFSSAVLPLPDGTHTISGPEPFGITVEGLDTADSYIFPGGARIERINPFCGDGFLNLPFEECDLGDFDGSSCGTFGFAGGFLQCTSDCAVDTSQCSGVGSPDADADGFPADEDCDDFDPAVHPGMDEILGNGKDDDCNPATPDQIPEGTVACSLTTLQFRYLATDLLRLEAVVESSSSELSLTGLEASLEARLEGASTVFAGFRELAPLPPGGRFELGFEFPAVNGMPGDYRAELTLLAGTETVAVCGASFSIESTAANGAGLSGELVLDPEEVNAGDPSTAFYRVENQGNATVEGLGLRVVLLDVATGAVVDTLQDTATLPSGTVFEADQPLSTEGLFPAGYPAVLLARPAGGPELTLDTAVLNVVNTPPDCSGALAVPAELWPPNHGLVRVDIEGVIDPDGDPVILTVLEVFQDEPTDDLGDGAFCPDTVIPEDGGLELRAERQGGGDGRIYHVFFLADDGRGGTCEGKVAVCVPHDRKAACTDQGLLFRSAICS